MIYLIIVSVIWALSFGLIKGNLNGIDSGFVAFARLFISFLFFTAFLRIKKFGAAQIFNLLIIGAIQFGLMYIFYIYSYNYLKAWQIALFTIFTPLYVTIINDLLNRRFNLKFLIAAVFSIIGAAIIVFNNSQNVQLQMGFILMQLSNICFALGQIFYKRIRNVFTNANDAHLFAWLYCGAFIVSGLNSFFNTDYENLQLTWLQVYTLLYLGILASGICFFLWNYGATKVNAGSLAVFNNLKVPLGVAASKFIFGENGNLIRMIIGGMIIVFALYICEYHSVKAKPEKI